MAFQFEKAVTLFVGPVVRSLTSVRTHVLGVGAAVRSDISLVTALFNNEWR